MSKKNFLELHQQFGEVYAGLVLGGDGEADYHLFLNPHMMFGVTWGEAVAWANQIGASLPTRNEQHILFANAREYFHLRWYWSSEQPGNKDYAFMTDFNSGSTVTELTKFKYNARLVRRVYLLE